MRKVKYGIIYISILVVLILASGTVSAADITVNPGGSIQTAINQASNNDVVILNDNNGAAYTYTENVVINKDLTLKSDGSVTVQALNASKPVVTVNSGGSGSTISGLTISGATKSSGILLNSASNCVIDSNDISNNRFGVYLSSSRENTITGNSISNNPSKGFNFISGSNNNLISRNIISGSNYGLYFEDSESNQVLENSITNNTCGLYLFESVNTEVHFNRIYTNQYGIHSDLGSYTNNAQNNWWGHNNPSSEAGDILINDGSVIYNPWLIFDVSADPKSLNGTISSSVTADITYNNQGDDTSSSGCVPNGLPVNFTTNIGTVVSPAYTCNGKATATFDCGSISSGIANIQATMDNQTKQVNITIGTVDTTPPTVSASPAGGTYSSAQTVYLSVSDNVDPSPAIYYTLNGSAPTTSSSRYTGPISVGTSVSLSFVAVDASGNISTVQSQYYTIYTNNSGAATLTVTSTALDASTGHEVIVGYNTTTESKVFNWYRLAKLLAGPTGDVYVLENYLINSGYDIEIWNMAPLPESIVKNLIFNNLYNYAPNNGGWWSEEALSQFVDEWGLSPQYEQYIKYNYQSWDVVNELYGLMWNDVGDRVVQYPPLYEQSEQLWLNRIWSAGNTPYLPFPQTLDYVPRSWVQSVSTTVPITQMQYSPLSVSYQIPLSGSVDGVSVVFKQQNVSFDLVEKMEVWVNGQLMLTKTFFNYYCPTYNTYYQTHNIPVGAVCEDNVYVTLNYPGGTITKNEQITYMDDISSASDISHPETAFESMLSFAITNTKITDSTVQSWLYQSSQFPAGYKKAMYGTFMTALTTLWLSDKLADEIASPLNVTWNRNTTTAVMTGVNNNGTAYVHTPDASMGMGVTGGVGDVKFFRLVCSLLLSEVENASLSGTGLSVNSTFSTFMSAIRAGNHFKMSSDNKAVIITLEGDPSFRIIIDYETGVVKEITDINGFSCKGVWSTESAYCYHDQLSNHLPEFISAVKQDASNLFNQLGVGWIGDHYGEIKNGVELFVNGACIIVTKLSIIASISWMFEMGNGAIYFRDNYLPSDFWLKVSYHDIWNKDVYWYVDPNDNQMHYTEVPKS